MKELRKIFMNGIIDENPTFRMVLGTCPTLAITTAVSNGIGMGLATTVVLICSNLFISLLRKAIPDAWEGINDFRFLACPEAVTYRTLNRCRAAG